MLQEATLNPSANPAWLQRADQAFSTLFPAELRWRDRQQFLESRGYMLRPRYHPGWVPSWRAKKVNPTLFEDCIPLPLREHLVDATRIADSRPVYIKRVQTGDDESQIALMLSAESIRNDSHNHCVPILEVFQDDEDPETSYLVMPFLRLIDHPPFEIVEEVVDCIHQIMEGLVFLHQQGVAHRDCTYKNIMMDASQMYPQGAHPVHWLYLPDGTTPNYPLPRRSVPIKYYYIDFGLSVYFPSDVHPRLVLGEDGRDQEVPELSDEVPYDPFMVDIFIIGNLLRHEFYDKFTNFNFLLPLIDAMTRTGPQTRPDAINAFEQWRSIQPRLSILQRQWRVRPRGEPLVGKAIFDTAALVRTAGHLTARLMRIAVDMTG